MAEVDKKNNKMKDEILAEVDKKNFKMKEEILAEVDKKDNSMVQDMINIVDKIHQEIVQEVIKENKSLEVAMIGHVQKEKNEIIEIVDKKVEEQMQLFATASNSAMDDYILEQLHTWDGKTCSDEKNIPFRNSTHFSPSWCPESPPKISKSGHYGILRKGLFRFFCLLRTIFFIFGPFWAVFWGGSNFFGQ